MDEYLRFENAIFCSSNYNFLKFSAHNLSLLLIFLTFLLLIMYLQLSIYTTDIYKKKTIGYQIQCSECSVLRFSPLSSTLCSNLIIPNITPGGFFGGGGGGQGGGGLIHGRSFPFQKLVLNAPGLIQYTRWGLLSEFYGILYTYTALSFRYVLYSFS